MFNNVLCCGNALRKLRLSMIRMVSGNLSVSSQFTCYARGKMWNFSAAFEFTRIHRLLAHMILFHLQRWCVVRDSITKGCWWYIREVTLVTDLTSVRNVVNLLHWNLFCWNISKNTRDRLKALGVWKTASVHANVTSVTNASQPKEVLINTRGYIQE